MNGQSSKRGQSSKASKRSAEAEIIDFSGSSSPAKRSSRAGPSRIAKDTIVIDDDDEDEDAEMAYYQEQYESDMKRERKEVSMEKTGSADLDQLEAREAVRAALTKLDSEMDDVRAQIQPLQALLGALAAERRDLESQLSSLHQQPKASSSRQVQASSSRQSQAGPSRSRSVIDYHASDFEWSSSLIPLAKSTFDIPAFRLCQEGVINAAIDGRDIVCVMPTGGGKSLTYQLPAVLGKTGVTIVISPLLALIWDQVRALREIGVEAVMLTGSTSKMEENEIYRRLEKGGGHGEKEIRLCYLTPEKVAKSKRLTSVFEKAYSSGRLRRFVIDEAHCCSQLGHDFRPDYKQLGVLKMLFPRVPIQAVTATLSTKTLPDLLKILRMAPICDGKEANTTGTVFFTAPLYRPNLHYKVIPKPSSAKGVTEAMGKWILENHSGKSGIIYCFSKKDAEVVAESLREWSQGDIKTGVYHAGIDDTEKERIHLNWRMGKVNCICATIAFGLGIDKGDVRYVIHHALSKNIDGYYQETGRAGRDGKDSDCVLFYRGQDATRLMSMVYRDLEGPSKLHEMMRFAQDLQTCRKVAFAKYFSTSAKLSANAWDNAATLDKTSGGGSLMTCGICDNCTRDESTIVTVDVTLHSWRILKVLGEVVKEGGKVTVAALGDLVRGLGGTSFLVTEGRKKKTTEKVTLDIDELAGGKVSMSKDDTERLVTHLMLVGYLEEFYSPTAYSVNVYLQPSAKSLRLSRLSVGDVQGGKGQTMELAFLNMKRKAKVVSKKKSRTVVIDGDEEEPAEEQTEDDEAERDEEDV